MEQANKTGTLLDARFTIKEYVIKREQSVSVRYVLDLYSSGKRAGCTEVIELYQMGEIQNVMQVKTKELESAFCRLFERVIDSGMIPGFWFDEKKK